MMRNIYLHGRLKKLFGAKFRFNVATAGEAFRALHCALRGPFLEAISEGEYRVIRGRRQGGMDLGLEEICGFKLGSADLHIVPIAKGASSKGTGTVKAVVGLAIVGTAIFMSGGTLAAPLAGMSSAVIPGFTAISWGTVATLGLGMTLAGASSMLAKNEAAKTEADDKSYSFNGPVNVNEQGNVVPIIVGEVICGSQPISATYDIEDLSTYRGGWGSLPEQQGFVGPAFGGAVS